VRGEQAEIVRPAVAEADVVGIGSRGIGAGKRQRIRKAAAACGHVGMLIDIGAGDRIDRFRDDRIGLS
jgi:hypothetical protein